MAKTSASSFVRLTGLRILSGIFGTRLPTILMYHSVVPGADHFLSVDTKRFEWQLQSLQDSGSKFASFDSVTADLRAGKAIDPATIVITFDDGYRDNLKHALPVLERFKAPAVIYVATSFVEKGESPRQIPVCSPDEVRELARHPLVTIGAHSHEHHKLTKLSLADAERDISKGNKILEDMIGQPVRHFAYPKGACSAELAEMIRRLGFESGVTIKPGWIRPAANLMLLPRVPIDDNIPEWLFKKIWCEGVPYYEVLKDSLGL